MEKIKVSEIEIIVTGKKRKTLFWNKIQRGRKATLQYWFQFIQPGLCLRLERKVFRGD